MCVCVCKRDYFCKRSTGDKNKVTASGMLKRELVASGRTFVFSKIRDKTELNGVTKKSQVG